MANRPSTSPAKERIVCLDECHCEIPVFNIQHSYTSYNNTSAELIAERIKDATIIITTRVPLSRAVLEQCPELQLVAVMAAGYDIIDLEACRNRGIRVCNIPSASAEAVAEHAITLYLSVKRRVVELHALTKQGEEWPLKKTAIHRYGGLPRTCRSETMGIIGYGTLGKRIETIAKALGITVIVSERKGASPTATRPGRTEFYEMLEKSDVVVLCCPLDGSTRDMVGLAELKHMRRNAILVNVSRGGTVDEDALATALKEHWIGAAATDVFAVEPASASSSPLLADDIPNLTLSPHVAWYADSSIENLKRSIQSNIESFVKGESEKIWCLNAILLALFNPHFP